MKLVIVVIVLTILATPFAYGQTPSYQGASIQPGDVINFHGGVFTTCGFLTYGHSALYLGVDPETGKHSFLDFTISKVKQRAFVGRILPEKEFLTISAEHHLSFDVFRLQDVSNLNQQIMLQEAKLIAVPDNLFGFSEVCATAVASVLSKTTGMAINAKTPDDFVGGQFQRHPQLLGKSINIEAALREIAFRYNKPNVPVVPSVH